MFTTKTIAKRFQNAAQSILGIDMQEIENRFAAMMIVMVADQEKIESLQEEIESLQEGLQGVGLQCDSIQAELNDHTESDMHQGCTEEAMQSAFEEMMSECNVADYIDWSDAFEDVEDFIDTDKLDLSPDENIIEEVFARLAMKLNS